METKESNSNHTATSSQIIFLSIIVIIIVAILFLFLLHDHSSNLKDLGDTFGGILGPIGALIGIVLFYFALRDQQKSTTYQAQEMSSSTKALQESNRIQGENNKVLSEQIKQMRISSLIEAKKILFDFYTVEYKYHRKSCNAEYQSALENRRELFNEIKILIHTLES